MLKKLWQRILRLKLKEAPTDWKLRRIQEAGGGPFWYDTLDPGLRRILKLHGCGWCSYTRPLALLSDHEPDCAYRLKLESLERTDWYDSL